MVGIIDIDERMDTIAIDDEEYSEATEVLRVILNAMPPNVCVLLKDDRYNWILANDSAAKTCGFGDSLGAIGKSDDDTWATAAQIEQFKASDRRVLAGEDQIHIIEEQTRDDGLHWLDGNKRLIEYRGNSYLLACWIDITDLVDARKEAERRRELMSVVLDIFAHDTGSALRGIKGMAWMLRDELVGLDAEIPENIPIYLDRIDASCDRLQRLNTAVSQTRQFEGQEVKLVLASTLFEAIHRDIVEANFSCLEINYGLSQDFMFKANLDSITTHVFGNLVENAIKYAGRSARITLTARRENGSGLFYFTNTGSHIPEKFRDKVFLPGQRSRLQPHIPGTGTGLFSAASAIDSIGGNIWVAESTADRCRFGISVPCVDNRTMQRN